MRSLAILILLSIIAGLSILLIDLHWGTSESIEARLALQERKLMDRVRPVIQINRATIYNSQGEIVIEEVHGKKEPAQQK